MLELIDQPMIMLFAVCLVTSLCGYYLLYSTRRTNSKFLKKHFYVLSPKARTGAILLGGLPLAVSIIVSLLGYLYVFEDTNFFPPIDRSILKCWLISSLGIVVYGYLDDRFEFRPIVKLSSQVFSMFVYAFYASMLFLSIDSRLAFIFTFGLSLVIINGGNLLDGMDTLTVKNSLATLTMFFLIGAIFHSYPIVMLSLLMIIPVGIFWFCNKEPSKIHLGEIGGTFIGFSYILLASLTYKWLSYYEDVTFSFSMAFIPISLPLVEVIVSTARRIYNKKSPMSGDRMHVHHILAKQFNFSHTRVANRISMMNFITMGISLFLGLKTHPLIGLLSVFALQIGHSLFVGGKYWRGDNVVILTPRAVFRTLRKSPAKKEAEIIEFELEEKLKKSEESDEKSAA